MVHNFAVNNTKVLLCDLTSDGEILVCSDDKGFVWMQKFNVLINILKFDTSVKLLHVFETQNNSVVVAVDDKNSAKVRANNILLFYYNYYCTFSLFCFIYKN